MLDAASLDLIFREARTRYDWSADPVTDADLRAIYDLAKFGPTSANGNPARFVFCRTPAARQALSECVAGNNTEKVLAAPVTVIIAQDEQFFERLPELFPHADARSWFAGPDKAGAAHDTAFRNASLQGAYFVIAARALGFDCGPMSGFDAAAVNARFLGGTTWTANFICSIGHGTDKNLFPRLPRLAFEDACRLD